MTTSTNPLPWIIWGFAVTLVTIATRNPLYLALVLSATAVVYLSRRPKSGSKQIWSIVIRVGLLVAGVSVCFNLLTAHSGDQILVRIPGAVPIIGGVITANALVYGVSSALAILSLIIAAATFGSIVDRASLLRSVPQSLSSAGVAAVIGLSFFPQTLVSLREVREAQAARGFRIRSVRDIRPLVVPVLSLGLESAFSLAEAMESRAFGGEPRSSRSKPWLFVTGIFLAIIAVSLMISGRVVGAALFSVASVGLIAIGLIGSPTSRTSYRPSVWRPGDWMMLVFAATSFSIFGIAILFFSTSVEWSPFPTLRTPVFNPLLGVACLLLVAPALTASETR